MVLCCGAGSISGRVINALCRSQRGTKKKEEKNAARWCSERKEMSQEE
jgi:hypothetical protein